MACCDSDSVDVALRERIRIISDITLKLENCVTKSMLTRDLCVRRGFKGALGKLSVYTCAQLQNLMAKIRGNKK